jgi:hypothetical protein
MQPAGKSKSFLVALILSGVAGVWIADAGYAKARVPVYISIDHQTDPF